MIGIDTNVLLRMLLNDDLAQLEAVSALFSRVASTGDHVFLSVPVMTETVFVLLRVKKRSKSDVIAAMHAVLDMALFVVEQEDAVREALDAWKLGTAGFNDYLIGAIAHAEGCDYTATFDADLLGTKLGQYRFPG